MNRDRFDTLSRALASGASRRGLLARLTTGVLAALPLALGNDEAEAKPCPPCRKKKRGTCKQKRPNGTACGACRACQGGQCEFLPAGVSCGTGKTCQRGVCADCAPGLSPCTPDPFNACCSGTCSQAQPDVFLCEPHG